MKKITLHIETSGETKTVALEDELSVGRTSLAQLVLDDTGLSRVNTTFFRDGDMVFVADENSLNGTFLNGERVSGAPKRVFDGDLVTLGSETRISVKTAESFDAATQGRADSAVSASASGFSQDQRPKTENPKTNPQSAIPNPKSNKPPFILIAAGASFFLIIFGAIMAILFAGSFGDGGGNKTRPTPQISSKVVIPIRVIDPLGGEDPDDLDDLIASWEVEEEELKAESVKNIEVTTTESVAAEDAELAKATVELLRDRQAKAFERRNGETGIRPAGLNVPRELFGDGVIKQKAKLREMNATGYKQPLDFAELAQKRINKELIEMPMATQSFYLDVGGSAKDSAFTSFSFKDGNQEIAPGSPKYQSLLQLAANFGGMKYDLNNPSDRKQMRMRLLRMFNLRAKPILKKLADAYYQKFNRPLRVTSLTRSMDYQIGLNATNANSFKVRGEGSLPPHTSGCAFDLARKHMTAEEQNFVMEKLAEMEKANELDALIEYGTNACFHVFIYSDGIPPKM